jgi:hypothetical protein
MAVQDGHRDLAATFQRPSHQPQPSATLGNVEQQFFTGLAQIRLY